LKAGAQIWVMVKTYSCNLVEPSPSQRSPLGTQPLYIEPGSPWENGYCESCNSKPRDELLNGEIFSSLKEAQIVIERWRVHYNTGRPHSVPATRSAALVAVTMAAGYRRALDTTNEFVWIKF
jgi:putative transposase